MLPRDRVSHVRIYYFFINNNYSPIHSFAGMQSFGALGQPVALCLFVILGTIVGGVGFPLIFAYHPDFKTDAMQRSAESICQGLSRNVTEILNVET